MQAVLTIVSSPGNDVRQQEISLSRLPVLGEYIRSDDEWFEVKRVAHLRGNKNVAGEIYAIPAIDPTREPLRVYEWLEPAP